MYRIDSIATLLQKHLLKKLKQSALWIGLGAGSLFAGQLPSPLAPPALPDANVTANHTVKKPAEPSSWIVVLAGEPLAAKQGKQTQAKSAAGHTQAVSEHKQQLQSIRDRFLAGAAQSGRRGKSATAAIQPTQTFETLVHGVVMKGNRADADHWAKQAEVLGVYPNRRLQLAPVEQREAAQAKTAAAKVAFDGDGQVIAILDTGIDYNHPDLGGGFGPDYKVIGGYDFIDNDADPMDEHYHGTHVAGIAAADGGMQGMAPRAKLLAYRVLDAYGFGSDASLIAGLEAAVDPDGDPSTDDGADVINISLGGPGSADDPASLAVDYAVATGAVVVVAAGNDGPNTWSIGSPGAARDAVTVGAVNPLGALTWYSSFGPAEPDVPKPDISALGDIESTVPGGGYLFESGTSMAAPAVAGAAALLRQAHPDLDPIAVKTLLQAGADPIDGLPFYQQGSGILNIEKSLQTTVSADTGLINFGRLNHAVDNLTQTRALVFTNRGEEPVSIAIPSLPQENGLAVTIAPSQLEVAPGEQATFTVTVDIDNATWPYLRDQAWFDERRLTVNIGDQVQQLTLTASKFLTFSVSAAQPELGYFNYALVNEAGHTVTANFLQIGRKYRVEPGYWDLLVSGFGYADTGVQRTYFQNFKETLSDDHQFLFDADLCRIPFEQTIIGFDGKPITIDVRNRIASVNGRSTPDFGGIIREVLNPWEEREILFSNWPVNHDLFLHETVSLGGNRIVVLPTTVSGREDGRMPVYDVRKMAKVELDLDMANSEELFNRNHLSMVIMDNQGGWLHAQGIYRESVDPNFEFNPNQSQGNQKVTLYLPGPDQTWLAQSRPEPVQHLTYMFQTNIASFPQQSTDHFTPYFTVNDDLQLIKTRFTQRWATEKTDERITNQFTHNRLSLFPTWGMYLTNNGLDYLYSIRQNTGTIKNAAGFPVRVAHHTKYEKDGVLLGTSETFYQLVNPEPGAYRITVSGMPYTYAGGKDLTVTLETQVDENGPELLPAPVLENLTWNGNQGTLFFYDRVAAHNYEQGLSDIQPTGFDPRPITVEAAVRPIDGETWTPLAVNPRGDQPGVFTFTAPTPALGETLSLRVRATDPNGDRMTYESPAYFQRGVVQELPASIGENDRFGLLTLTNHGEAATETILIATDADGREQRRSIRLHAGAVKPLLPAALFSEMRNYRLRLLTDSDAVTMAFKNGFAENKSDLAGQDRTQLSQGQSFLNLLYNADAVLELNTLFPAGLPQQTSTVLVSLWDGEGRQTEATVELVEGRPTGTRLSDLFPDYTNEGPISLRLVSNEGHKLHAGLRDGKKWINGVADQFGWDNRRFYLVPAHKNKDGAALTLLNRRYTQMQFQLRAVSLENGEVWAYDQDLLPGMTTLALSEMVPFTGAYHLEIRNFHNHIHSAVILGEGDNRVRVPAVDGLDLGSHLTFDGFSMLKDTRLMVNAPDSTVDSEVVVSMTDLFGRPVEKVFTLKAGKPLMIRTPDLLRLGFPQIDGTRLTLRAPENVNLWAYGIEGGLFKKLKVTTARRR